MDTYYHPHDLGKFADMGKGNKELWEKFMSYYSAVFAEGALTEREKALIALGVAHAVQCGGTDRSRPRGLCDPRRSLAGARRANAECRRETIDVGKGPHTSRVTGSRFQEGAEQRVRLTHDG